MSELEQQLSRREFIRLLIAGSLGVAAFQPILPSLAAQQKSRQIFERSGLYNLNSLPPITLEESMTYTVLTSYERKVFDSLVSNKLLGYPKLIGKDAQFKGAYVMLLVKLEPDEVYANNLIKEAKNSIDDIFEFLGSHYLPKPQINFIVPRNKEDIKFTGHSFIPFYLVSKLQKIVKAEYEFDINGKKLLIPVPVERIEESGGESATYILVEVKEKGTKLQAKLTVPGNTPIFYNTSHNLVARVEAPAIEALHKAMSAHTFKNFYDDSKARNIASHSEILSPYNGYNHLEEKFVHALSILWLRQYNSKRKILTREEIEQRFARYETMEKYRGTNKLSQHIKRIGVQKAIELYVNNPHELFKILK